VLVVLNPTARRQTLRALDMRATVDREEFFQFQHGDCRLRLTVPNSPQVIRR
jgi:hypothetical protein